MLEQRAFAARADAGNLVEGIGADGLAALGAVGADGEAMGLVAQPLHEIEHRIARFQHHRPVAAGHMKMLAAGIAVRPLGDADQGHVANAEVFQHLPRDAELAEAAIDQDEVGPVGKLLDGRIGIALFGAVCRLLTRFRRRHRSLCPRAARRRRSRFRRGGRSAAAAAPRCARLGCSVRPSGSDTVARPVHQGVGPEGLTPSGASASSSTSRLNRRVSTSRIMA